MPNALERAVIQNWHFDVYNKGKKVGCLWYDDIEGEFVFVYDDKIPPSYAVSLTMPVTNKEYRYQILHPVFQQNLPEGFLREWLLRQIDKQIPRSIDAFIPSEVFLLAIVGHNQIGKIQVLPKNEPLPEKKKLEDISLSELLGVKLNQKLVEKLLTHYGFQSGVAGVQPKVLADLLENRTTFQTTRYILKFANKEYAALPLNEYICLETLRRAGIMTVKAIISEDHQLLAVERFDKDLSFEEFSTLFGVGSEGKYAGDYYDFVNLANNLKLSAKERKQLAERIIASLVFRDGDAHLKNFGVLYSWQNNMLRLFLAPAYDVVCTTVYIQNDRPALAFNGDKEWPNRKKITDFVSHLCGLSVKQSQIFVNNILGRLEKAFQSVLETIDPHDKLEKDLLSRLKDEVEKGLSVLKKEKQGKIKQSLNLYNLSL